MIGVSISCENERTSAELINSLEGRWFVEEEDPIFDKTTYYVSISISSEDSSRIIISNFYQCDGEVKGSVVGQQINLDKKQEIYAGGSPYKIISGSGTITDDYKYIDWQYQVDEGTGNPYDVTARYEKE